MGALDSCGRAAWDGGAWIGAGVCCLFLSCYPEFVLPRRWSGRSVAERIVANPGWTVSESPGSSLITLNAC